MSTESKKSKAIPTGMLAYIVAAREMRCASPHSKCLLQYYASNVDRQGKFFKSLLDICAETGLSQSFVRKTNAYWKKINLLSWEEGSWTNGKANVYRLSLPHLKAYLQNRRPEIETTKLHMRQQSAVRVKRWRSKKAGEPAETLVAGVTLSGSVTETPSDGVTKPDVTPPCNGVTPSHALCNASIEGDHEPKHEPITYMNSGAPFLNEGRKGTDSLARGAPVTPSQGVTDVTPLDGVTPSARTVADILKLLPKARAHALYARYDGVYGLREAEAELRAWQAEQAGQSSQQ
jgi:hypothetical protein